VKLAESEAKFAQAERKFKRQAEAARGEAEAEAKVEAARGEAEAKWCSICSAFLMELLKKYS
jgi:vacuolar-type H+-ATPase subunit E/Vma4